MLHVHNATVISAPVLSNALDDVCRKSGVLVDYSLSRLARSTKDTLAISERLDTAGADLVSLSEKLDTTSAAGKMIFRILAVLAEFERDQISDRTKMALAHKKAHGERLGKVPYGYKVADCGVMLVPDPAELRVIDFIHALKEQGLSLRRIAAELDARLIATKELKGQWRHQSVESILKRKTL